MDRIRWGRARSQRNLTSMTTGARRFEGAHFRDVRTSTTRSKSAKAASQKQNFESTLGPRMTFGTRNNMWHAFPYTCPGGSASARVYSAPHHAQLDPPPGPSAIPLFGRALRGPIFEVANLLYSQGKVPEECTTGGRQSPTCRAPQRARPMEARMDPEMWRRGLSDHGL